jgi:adenylate cyclase class 2
MTYEVELKFPVRDRQAAWERLAALGAVAGEPIAQADRYFAHPSRNFAETDEALRLRSIGATNILTYKGPVIDTRTKMRREIEVELESGDDGVQRAGEILQHLGFRPVRTVAKTRREGTLTWEDRALGWTWDEVPPLGEFVELEIITDESHRDAARDALCRLAQFLSLGPSERRSYLELLLEYDRSVPAKTG